MNDYTKRGNYNIMKRILTTVLTAVLLLSNIGNITAHAATTQMEQTQVSHIDSTTDTDTSTEAKIFLSGLKVLLVLLQNQQY